MSDIDEFLESIGLNYDDLDTDEQKSYEDLLRVEDQEPLNIVDIQTFILRVKDMVEARLTSHDLTKAEDLFLKARLANYRVLELLLFKPERDKQAIKKYFNSLKAAYKQKV